jgi:hypothetical protein
MLEAEDLEILKEVCIGNTTGAHLSERVGVNDLLAERASG